MRWDGLAKRLPGPDAGNEGRGQRLPQGLQGWVFQSPSQALKDKRGLENKGDCPP